MGGIGSTSGGAAFANAICGASKHSALSAREVLGWPKRCELARAFLWEYSYVYKRLNLTQRLGQLGAFLTQDATPRWTAAARA